ncbi:MAG: FTR1 family protein [Firmicutes bacterium]|nr:FTR1 family protein [Bacillota bacterium]
MLPTLVIFARESLEGSMIVAILLSYLDKIGQQPMRRQIWLGVAFALACDLALGVIIFSTIHHYAGTRLQTILEGGTYFLAAIILTSMSFWMKNQSRGIKKHLEHDVDMALQRGSRLGLVTLTAVTVGREGLETVVFMLAIAFQTHLPSLVLGAVLGLSIGLGISDAIYRMGRRVPLGTFFNLFGVLLLIFGAALLADGIEDYQSIGWLPWSHPILWYSGHWLSEQSAIGDVLHTFFGYASQPSVFQMASYALFLALTLTYYLRRHKKGPRPQ